MTDWCACRPAGPEDTSLIMALIGELAVYERLTGEVDADEAMFARALFAPLPRVYCDLADLSGTPAGFALWFYNFSTFRGRHGLFLEDIYVRPEARGRGVGKALLRALAQRCLREGLARLDWAVLDWNTSAIGFYQAQGARVLDEWRLCRVSDAALARLAGAPDAA